jgi:hypothetical protein
VKTREEQTFENELKRRLAPAKPPEEFMARLLAAAPRQKVPARAQTGMWRPGVVNLDWARLLRWLVPASAVAVLAVVLLQGSISLRPGSTASAAPLKADAVQINEQLVSSFDAVAKLPTGEPVRFRFQKWMDDVVLRDKHRGLVVENRTPRIEVIPVGFETY